MGLQREAGVDDIGYTVSNIWACRVPCVRTCLCCCRLIMQSKQSDLPATAGEAAVGLFDCYSSGGSLPLIKALSETNLEKTSRKNNENNPLSI